MFIIKGQGKSKEVIGFEGGLLYAWVPKAYTKSCSHITESMTKVSYSRDW